LSDGDQQGGDKADNAAAANVVADDHGAGSLADLNLLDTDNGSVLLIGDGENLSFDGLAGVDFSSDDFFLAGDGGLAGAAANDSLLAESDGGDDVLAALGAGDLAHFAHSGVGGFAELDLLDSDDGAILYLADGGTLTLDGLHAAQLGEQGFAFATDDDFGAFAGDDSLIGTEAGDALLTQPDGGYDVTVDFAAVDLIDVDGLGLAGFDALALDDSDSSCGLAAGESEPLTVDEVDVSLPDADFLIDG
jgi:hypothetical protein